MKFLTPYQTKASDGRYRFSGEQGSAFAKQVADDFNPIHHPDSRRFCVPGDLLFAVALGEYGLHSAMSFRFLDLLSADVMIDYPAVDSVVANFEVKNEKSKPTLGIAWSGDVTRDEQKIESLVRTYVSFSGQNFPHILVPLMREHGVMINPQRPLVIYESMSLEFTSLDFTQLSVELNKTTLAVNGKRGDAKLHFDLLNAGKNIGSGLKSLVLSGLREFDETAIQAMCDEYRQSKEI
jgi:hypothetical protein